ncbi:hypothetical protein TEA_003293 [Camellia sinensis var. sinensis]|uniref:Late embryogenesis abundant protein LEA-2 subgroup domain-containing protein n=1 Tax=Camellia sinensis var. sinensis TaxID=542762 RepID=A0A4S4D5M7_CAMSN|nr:hypothetical protein TEA_003293 [Camellia sinensis var. sinensis]
MEDHQRIHPAHDSEAPQEPMALLMPSGSSKSDKGNPVEYPPFRRTIPVMYSKPPKRRSCCFKCFCWTTSLLILLIVIIAIVTTFIYVVFQPEIPKYSIDSMRITQFNLNNDTSLSAVLNVNFTATNPNKKIGIYYEHGSHISMWYADTQLCQGFLPKFYQSHQNVTVLDVALTGQTLNATDLLHSMQEQQQSGSIPLNLRVKVPVRINLGSLKLMKWKFLVRCNLVVDSLATDNSVTLKTANDATIRVTQLVQSLKLLTIGSSHDHQLGIESKEPLPPSPLPHSLEGEKKKEPCSLFYFFRIV